MKIKENPQVRLNRLLIEVGQKLPSFSSYVWGWDFRIEKMRFAAAVRKNLVTGYSDVVVGEDALKTFPDNDLKGVLVHEFFHIFNRHFQRQQNSIKDITIIIPELGVMTPFSLWNISTDLAINQTIKTQEFKKLGITLPKGCLDVNMLPPNIQVGVRDKDSEEIFAFLKKEYEKDSEKFKKMLEKIKKEIQEQQQEYQKENQQNQGEGQGQGEQGQGDPSQSKQGGTDFKGDRSQKAEKQETQDGEGGSNGSDGKESQMKETSPDFGYDDHSELGEGGLNPESAKYVEDDISGGDKGDNIVEGGKEKKMSSSTEVAGKHGQKVWNHSNGDPLKGEIQKYYGKYRRLAEVKNLLRGIRSTLSSNASSLIPQVSYSFKKTPRRKYGISRTYGVAYKAKTKRFQSKDLLIALDTSGSVSDLDIQMAIDIINGFITDYSVNVTFIQCDNVIREVKKYKGKIEDVEIKGRSGTNYQPVFDYLKKNYLAKGEPAKNLTLVYIGDGGTSSDIDNYKINTVWLFTPNYDLSFEREVKFGKKYIIPRAI